MSKGTVAEGVEVKVTLDHTIIVPSTCPLLQSGGEELFWEIGGDDRQGVFSCKTCPREGCPHQGQDFG